MNRQKISMLLAFLALTAAAAGLIVHARAHQRLGLPGVRTVSLPGTHNLKVVLPEHVPGFTAEITNQPDEVVNALPADTSFGRCIYTAPDGFWTVANVVLMGTDRSSIHKPQVCLTAQGWAIEDAASKEEILSMSRPFTYHLPVMRLVATIQAQLNGQPHVFRGVYIYWFVDGTQFTSRHVDRMWWMARDMLTTGVLDRFAYISYFSVCEPGQEAATYERMKHVMVASVPEFQLVPRAGGPQTASTR